MAGLPELDEIISSMAGHTITVERDTGAMTISDFQRLPAPVRVALRTMKDRDPEGREQLLQELWKLGVPAGHADGDIRRCPQCPYRGRPAFELLPGVFALCDCKCPPGQKVRFTMPEQIAEVSNV